MGVIIGGPIKCFYSFHFVLLHVLLSSSSAKLKKDTAVDIVLCDVQLSEEKKPSVVHSLRTVKSISTIIIANNDDEEKWCNVEWV